jgi:protein-S-isoprenylcysteine O-methyltransferase Ste14
MRPSVLFAIIWIGWLVTWMAAAFWSAPVRKRAATWHSWAYRVALFAGAVLLLHSTRRGSWLKRGCGTSAMTAPMRLRASPSPAFCWPGGRGFISAHCGRARSCARQGHRVVDSGPYAWVRHPIYSGLILAILATAVAQGTIPGCLGAALIVIGFWLKARAEESFLTAELGAEAYGAYRRRVPMLVPFLPAG